MSPASNPSPRVLRHFGSSRVTVEFNDGVDLNVAAADMRDAISRITNTLPEQADPTADRQGGCEFRCSYAACRDVRYDGG